MLTAKEESELAAQPFTPERARLLILNEIEKARREPGSHAIPGIMRVYDMLFPTPYPDATQAHAGFGHGRKAAEHAAAAEAASGGVGCGSAYAAFTAAEAAYADAKATS